MENTMYDYVDGLFNKGCNGCPFIGEDKECDQGAGYTMMDEHGVCPVENINTAEDFSNAKFPENY